MTTVIAVASTHAEPARDRPRDRPLDRPERAFALALNHRAKELYVQGHYAESAALLREAYRQQPEPVLQYNLARACEKLDDYACAVAAYERYLESDPSDRAEVEARLASSRAHLPAARALELPPLGLPPPSPPDPPERASPPAGPAPRDPPRSLGPPIVSAIGAVGIGVGLALIVSARAHNDNAGQDPTQQGAQRGYEHAVSRMRIGTVTLLGGGVAAASGLVWWFLDARSRRSAPGAVTSGIAVTGDAVVFTSRF